MLKYIVCLSSFFIVAVSVAQQNTDNFYRKPLKEVLSDIEKKYDVKIKYADSMVVDKWVNYAEWRFLNDV